MDNTKVLCYSPDSDISPVCQNLEEVLSRRIIAAKRNLFFFWVAMEGKEGVCCSHKLRRLLFTGIPWADGWIDS